MKPVGKPDAGNPHVRFDERGRETERYSIATAPVLDSTSLMSERDARGPNEHEKTRYLSAEVTPRAVARPQRKI